MNSTVLQTKVLSPALEAQAHNDFQQQLLWNETVEIDSVSEALAIGDIDLAQRLLDQIAESNRLEREEVRAIAGYVDRAVSEGRANARLGLKTGNNGSALAKQLRVAIDAMEKADNSIQRALAAGSIWRAIDGKSRSEILRPTVTYQLGERRTHLITQLLDGEGV